MQTDDPGPTNVNPTRHEKVTFKPIVYGPTDGVMKPFANGPGGLHSETH